MVSGACPKKQRRTKKHWSLCSTIPRAQSLQLEFHKNAEPNSQLFVCWLSAVACQTGGVTVAPVSSPWYVSMAWHIMMDGQITCPWGLSGTELLKRPAHSWRSSSVPVALSVQSEYGFYFTLNRTKILLYLLLALHFSFLKCPPWMLNKDKK